MHNEVEIYHSTAGMVIGTGKASLLKSGDRHCP